MLYISPMTILNYIQIYLVVGLFFSLTIDLMQRSVQKQFSEEELKELKLTNYERFLSIVIWPIILIGLIELIITSNKKD